MSTAYTTLTPAAKKRVDTLLRMLDKARAEGITAWPIDGTNNELFVATASDGTRVYMVYPTDRKNGCSCEGYRKHMYCKHYALVLDMRGDLDGFRPEPPAAAPAPAPAPSPVAPEREAVVDALPTCWICGAEAELDQWGECEICATDTEKFGLEHERRLA